MNTTDDEKREIKGMIEKSIQDYSKNIDNTFNLLSQTDKITENTDLCVIEAESYMDIVNLGLHLYDHRIIAYSPTRHFWDLDTSRRDTVWNVLQKYLSENLFTKISHYLYENI